MMTILTTNSIILSAFYELQFGSSFWKCNVERLWEKKSYVGNYGLYSENAAVPGSVLARILKPFCNSYLI